MSAANPSGRSVGILERMLSIDRRWIFLLVAVAVTVPLFVTVEQDIPITPEVRGIYEALEALPAGSRVLLACDYDPGTAAEIQPMAVAFLRYAFRRHLRVIVMGLWPQGPPQAELAIRDALLDPDVAAIAPRYGIDYVNLGFQSGNEVVIQRMGSEIPTVFPQDLHGTPIGQFPIMDKVRNFDAIDYVLSLSAGYPGSVEWVQFAGDRFHAPIGTGTTAVSAPQVYPYFPQQLTGVMGGMKGAAEFEELTGAVGKGVRFMFSQSAAHGVVILFIVLGNLAHFLTRKKRKPGLGEAQG